MRLNILLGVFVGMCIVCVHCISDSNNEENLNAEANRPLEKYACERTKLRVVCPRGKVIKIIQANYGRFNDLATCNPKKDKKFNTKCKSRKSLTVMRQRCNQKRECSVDATNSVFGDPCPTTIKYLKIRYKCVTAIATTKIPPKKTTPRATTPKSKETTIKITTERPRPKITTKTLATFTTGKITPKVGTETTTKVTTEKLTPKVSTFEDTTLREVTTEENRPQSKHACEHNMLHVGCEIGKVIRVLKANYGRTSTEVCSQNIAKHWNINCVHDKTKEIMRKMCDGKKNCNVAAENSVFTDNCSYTLKYLEVHYLCEDEITIQPTSTTNLDVESSVTTTEIPKTTQEIPTSTTLKCLTEVLTTTSTKSPVTTSEIPVTTKLLVTASDDDVTTTSEATKSPTPEAISTHEPTPQDPSTTKDIPILSTSKPRVTAPETSCSEEDLDCIIDDLGKRPDWFICEKDMASYPHPASNKLFIFCLNWKPFVKKCGQERVFSEKLMTCINP
ncbi:hypothetical protein JTE90_016508 [Oedothorax gibbosus]|uniref:SUEL-type lectin domain-containing protein n=1 Tax=Oedothorax gibbosus TaxID=931172 RepID=A0AAV6U4T4_9ARAC|nr:hypothetical protein JTE90_016508 [Oedothorax gibbosus]